MRTLLLILISLACLSCSVTIGPDGQKTWTLDGATTTTVTEQIAKAYIDHNSGK